MVAAYRPNEKRLALVRAARDLLYRQGLERTSLADVASAAKVPLGNVYYYFKTKEALAEAVIAEHEKALRQRFADWDAAQLAPAERLRRLVLAPLDTEEAIVKFGCPHGSLCQELQKLGGDAPLTKASARLMGAYVEWATKQFRALGRGRGSKALAEQLIASVQGTLLLAHSLRSKALLRTQLRFLGREVASSPSRRFSEPARDQRADVLTRARSQS